MNKNIYRFLLSLLVIITLSTCKSRTVENFTTVTLSGWQSNPNEQQLLDRVLKKFEAENPNIKVKYEVINEQYMDVIKTRLIGDAAPDVFYLDSFEAPLLMKYEVLEPLDSYITAKFDLDDFEPSLLKAFRYNGKIYGLPKDFATLALFYNKKAFAEVGLSQPPQTWEELRDYSQKLTIDKNRDGRIDRYGFCIIPELSRQYFMIKAFGGQLIDRNGYAAFATPDSLKGLELLINQYRKERTAAQPTDVGADSCSEMLGQGKTVMAIEGSWAIPFLKETFPKVEFAIAEVPPVNEKEGTMAYTVAYVMNKQAQHKEAAWKLIAYLTGKQGMKAWASQGLAIPTRKSVLNELNYSENSLYTPFVEGAKYATIWQSGENLPTILTHFNNQFISALIGEQSLQDAMLKAQNTANREILAAK
ncbi:ABC transporter substrate-binding protein [Coleofasciculus sp. H7-2]|uniref:ABC transporter substrate-binding protein n=1 Tax=Coleofasciculus sp. H7-2 TaxID=3351545 RepID=UPI0036719C53